jgi:hypothetical protein
MFPTRYSQEVLERPDLNLRYMHLRKETFSMVKNRKKEKSNKVSHLSPVQRVEDLCPFLNQSIPLEKLFSKKIILTILQDELILSPGITRGLSTAIISGRTSLEEGGAYTLGVVLGELAASLHPPEDGHQPDC